MKDINVQEAYKNWADQYDTNINRTRDLEAISLRETLADIAFETCLEIGCGTEKNTEWLLTKAKEILAIDLSEQMLSKAKEKIQSDKVIFQQADILNEWTFAIKKFDLIGFSLVLEHIENLDFVFQNISKIIAPNGHIYIGELHPFKQYSGSKARFETENGQQIVTCFNHHISDFTQLAAKYGFQIVQIKEFFDDGNRNNLPRILTLLLRKAEATKK
jgi:2-polyprenyl-3-methyl-5-hydroxy-6-metoxy-1,4-benzoquinol methylase